jgi:hypothetical protein
MMTGEPYCSTTAAVSVQAQVSDREYRWLSDRRLDVLAHGAKKNRSTVLRGSLIVQPDPNLSSIVTGADRER